MSETTHRALRLALASLLMVTLLARFAVVMSRDEFEVLDLFGLFTVVSSVLAVIMLAMLAWRPERSSSLRFSWFRGAVTVYMSVAPILYLVLLAQTGGAPAPDEPWIEWTLYVVAPAAVALDWVLHAPPIDLPQSAPATWLALPAIYLTYTVGRGALDGWYPYPFLDPAESGGYPGVAMWVAAALGVILGLGYGYFWWANRSVLAPVTA
ncbi:MAG: Pr6Pr family membrane protein [Actinomycetota bacterium]